MNLDGETRRRGIELSVQAALKNVAFNLGYQYTDAEILDGPYAGSAVPGVPAHQVTLSGVLDLGRGVSLAAHAAYVGARPYISDFANTLPDQAGYFAMNAKQCVLHMRFVQSRDTSSAHFVSVPKGWATHVRCEEPPSVLGDGGMPSTWLAGCMVSETIRPRVVTCVLEHSCASIRCWRVADNA